MFDSSALKLAAKAKERELRQVRLAAAKHELAAIRAGQQVERLDQKITALRRKIRQGEVRLARLQRARQEVPSFLRVISD